MKRIMRRKIVTRNHSKNRRNRLGGTRSEIYYESVLMFSTILTISRETFVRKKKVSHESKKFVYASFAHVKNNKALLKIALSDKKAHDLLSMGKLRITVMVIGCVRNFR